jgi:hypothetical protein
LVLIPVIARVLPAPTVLWRLLLVLLRLLSLWLLVLLRLLKLRLLVLLWLLSLRLLVLLRLLSLRLLVLLRLLMLLWLLMLLRLLRMLLGLSLRLLMLLRLLRWWLLPPIVMRLALRVAMLLALIALVGQRLTGSEPKQQDGTGQSTRGRRIHSSSKGVCHLSLLGRRACPICQPRFNANPIVIYPIGSNSCFLVRYGSY